MRLRWKSFEKGMRRRVKAEIVASEALQREYHQALRARRRGGIRPGLLHCVYLLGMGMWLALDSSRSVESVVALLLLWTLGSMFWRAAHLLGFLYGSPDLNVFQHLPIADDGVFRAQWQRFLRHSIWSAVDFTAAYLVLAVKVGAGASSLATSVVFGAVQWLFVVAAATVLLAFKPRRWLGLVGALFGVSAFVWLVSGMRQRVAMEWLSAWAVWVPPMGWLLYAMGIAPTGGMVQQSWMCVLPALLLALFPMVYRRLKAEYELKEETLAHARQEPLPGAADEPAEQPARASAHAAEMVRSGGLLMALDWPKLGLVEALAARLFSERERLVAEFLVAANPRWTDSLRNAVLGLLVAVGLLWAFPDLRTNPTILLYGGLYCVIIVFSSRWRGLELVHGGGRQSPYFALYPISFWTIARVALKFLLLKFLIFVALAALVSVALGAAGLLVLKTNEVWVIAKVAFLLMAAPIVVVLLSISQSTNDTQEPGVWLTAILIALAMAGSAFTFIWATNLAVVFGVGGGLDAPRRPGIGVVWVAF